MLWFLLFFPQPPPLTDLEFLPPKQVCARLRYINSKLTEALMKERMMRPHKGWELTTAIARCELAEAVWNRLEDAHQDWNSEDYRRKALWNVRELLGEEAYYAGRVPLVGWCRKVD